MNGTVILVYTYIFVIRVRKWILVELLRFNHEMYYLYTSCFKYINIVTSTTINKQFGSIDSIEVQVACNVHKLLSFLFFATRCDSCYN